LPPEEIERRNRDEEAAIKLAAPRLAETGIRDKFRQRAAARHYAGKPSSLLDVSTDAEVAAFFATVGGTGRPAEKGRYGMLWAIDLGPLADLLSLEATKITGGWKVSLGDQRDHWGVNKQILDERNLPAVKFEIIDVELPLPRPTAQKGRFVSLEGVDGKPLPTEVELVWWSLLERWAYPTAFIQSGSIYENPEMNITAGTLLPTNDPFLTLAQP
jgi:hypothetical protein